MSLNNLITQAVIKAVEEIEGEVPPPLGCTECNAHNDFTIVADEKRATETKFELNNDLFNVNVEVNGLRPYGEDILEVPIYFHCDPLLVESLAYENPEEFMIATKGMRTIFEHDEYQSAFVNTYYPDEDVPTLTPEFKKWLKDAANKKRPAAKYPEYHDGKHYLKYRFTIDDAKKCIEDANLLFAGKAPEGYDNWTPSVRNKDWSGVTPEDKALLDSDHVIDDIKIRLRLGDTTTVKLSENFVPWPQLSGMDTMTRGVSGGFSNKNVGPEIEEFCTFDSSETCLMLRAFGDTAHPFALRLQSTAGTAYATKPVYTRESCFVKNYDIETGTPETEYSDTLKFTNGIAVCDWQGTGSHSKATYLAKIGELRAAESNTHTVSSFVIDSAAGKIVIDSPAAKYMKSGMSKITLTTSDASGNVSAFDGVHTVSAVISETQFEVSAEFVDASGVAVLPSSEAFDVANRTFTLFQAAVYFPQPEDRVMPNFGSLRNNNSPLGIHIRVKSRVEWTNAYGNPLAVLNNADYQHPLNASSTHCTLGMGLSFENMLGLHLGVNNLGLVLAHELGHVFGVNHNMIEGGGTPWHSGRLTTDYLNAINYTVLDRFRTSGIQSDDIVTRVYGPEMYRLTQDGDSVFDTPTDSMSGDKNVWESTLYNCSDRLLERMNSIQPQEELILAAVYGGGRAKLFSDRMPPKRFWYRTRSGYQIAPGGALSMTYVGMQSRMFYSRDQGRRMRNCICWYIPGALGVYPTSQDPLLSLEYNTLWTDPDSKVIFNKDVQVKNLNVDSLESSHVKTVKNVGKQLEYNYVKVLDEFTSQRTYSNVTYTTRQYINGWDMKTDGRGYLVCDPSTIGYIRLSENDPISGSLDKAGYVEDPSIRDIHFDNSNRSDVLTIESKQPVGWPKFSITSGGGSKIDMMISDNFAKVKADGLYNSLFTGFEASVALSGVEKVVSGADASGNPTYYDITPYQGQIKSATLVPAAPTSGVFDTSGNVNSVFEQFNGSTYDVVSVLLKDVAWEHDTLSGQWDVEFQITSTTGTYTNATDFGHSAPGRIRLTDLVRMSGDDFIPRYGLMWSMNKLSENSSFAYSVVEEDIATDSHLSSTLVDTATMWGPSNQKTIFTAVPPAMYHTVCLYGSIERANYPLTDVVDASGNVTATNVLDASGVVAPTATFVVAAVDADSIETVICELATGTEGAIVAHAETFISGNHSLVCYMKGDYMKGYSSFKLQIKSSEIRSQMELSF